MPSFLVLLSTLQISLWNWRLDVGDGKTVEHLECSREKLRHERNAYLEQVCLIYVPSPEELYILHPLACKNPVLMPIQFILICLLGLYSCYFQLVAFLCDCMKRAYWDEMDKGTSDLRTRRCQWEPLKSRNDPSYLVIFSYKS
jgi:hypothetical protein